MTIDTTKMCSHLRKKLFEPDGVYYSILQAIQENVILTAVIQPSTAYLPQWKEDFDSYMQITTENN